MEVNNFERYIRTVVLVYDFSSVEIRYFNKLNRILMPIVLVSALIEFIKSFSFGILDDNYVRILFIGFVFNWQGNQFSL